MGIVHDGRVIKSDGVGVVNASGYLKHVSRYLFWVISGINLYFFKNLLRRCGLWWKNGGGQRGFFFSVEIQRVKCGALACLAASARSSTIRGQIKITHSIKSALAEKWRSASKFFSQRVVLAGRFFSVQLTTFIGCKGHYAGVDTCPCEFKRKMSVFSCLNIL